MFNNHQPSQAQPSRDAQQQQQTEHWSPHLQAHLTFNVDAAIKDGGSAWAGLGRDKDRTMFSMLPGPIDTTNPQVAEAKRVLNIIKFCCNFQSRIHLFCDAKNVVSLNS